MNANQRDTGILPVRGAGLPSAVSASLRLQPAGRLAALLLAGLATFLTTCSQPDRFPPYDNSEEVEAYYKAQPDFFIFKSPADLPADLAWEDGMDLPELGSPEAVKGGTNRWFFTSFPASVTCFGPNSNNSFRGDHYDDIALWQVMFHPNVPGRYMPGVCHQWAIAPGRDVVYYRIDPEATFNNGHPVRTADFFMFFYIHQSSYNQDAWSQNEYRTKFKSITRYDDLTFAIALPEARPDPLFATAFPPADHIHYKEFGPDYPQRYQWRHEPTTGAYEIRREDIKMGESITMRRVKNWWARDRKFYRYRFNVDALVFRVFANPDKAFEAFKAQKMDTYHTYLDRQPQNWLDKMDVDEYHNGYICKSQFYNTYPRGSQGIYVNCSKPLLDDVRIRRGLHHAFHVTRVIEVVLKGEMDRMRTTSDGYGPLTHPTLQPREYSPEKAMKEFASAGFTERGPDGVLRHANGRRLSFELSIRERPMERRYALIFKEGALKCGVELRIVALDHTAQFTKVKNKAHELAFAGWVAQPPQPKYWEGYHSANAYEKTPDGGKKVKVETNNISETANPELDRVIDEFEHCKTMEELKSLAFKCEELIFEEASFIPAWAAPWNRTLYWRWVRWPEDFGLGLAEFAPQGHVHWIDESIRTETLAAMRDGRGFPVVNRSYEQYRSPAR